jgi:hypothetical protein
VNEKTAAEFPDDPYIQARYGREAKQGSPVRLMGFQFKSKED